MKKYLFKGRSLMDKKRTVTVGFWKWKYSEEKQERYTAYEIKVFAKTAQEASDKVIALDKRITGIIVDSVEELY